MRLVLFLALCLFPLSAQAAKCNVVANIAFAEVVTFDAKTPLLSKESTQAQVVVLDGAGLTEITIIVP